MRISEGQARTLAEAKELNLALPLNDGSKLNVIELGNSDNVGDASYLGKLAKYPNTINKGELAIVDNNLIIGSGDSKSITPCIEISKYKDTSNNIVNKKILIDIIDVYNENSSITTCNIVYKSINTDELNELSTVLQREDIQLSVYVSCEINGYPSILGFVNYDNINILIAISNYFSDILNSDTSITTLCISYLNIINNHVVTVQAEYTDFLTNQNISNSILSNIGISNLGAITFSNSELTPSDVITIKHTNIYDKIDTSKFIKSNQINYIDTKEGTKLVNLNITTEPKISLSGNFNNLFDIDFLTNPLNWAYGVEAIAINQLDNFKVTYYDDWTKIQVPDLTEIQNDDSITAEIDIDGLESENDEFKLGPAIVTEFDMTVEGNRYFGYTILFAYKKDLNIRLFDESNPIELTNSIGVFGTTAAKVYNDSSYNSDRILCVDNHILCIGSAYYHDAIYFIPNKTINTQLVTADNFALYAELNKRIEESNLKTRAFHLYNGNNFTSLDNINDLKVEEDASFTNNNSNMYATYADDNLSNALFYNNKVYLSLLKALSVEHSSLNSSFNSDENSAYDRELDKLKNNVSTFLLKLESLNYTYRFLLLDLTNYTPDLTDISDTTVMYNILNTINNNLSNFHTDYTYDGFDKKVMLVLPYIEYNVANDELMSLSNNPILKVKTYNYNKFSLIAVSNFYIDAIHGIEIFTKTINND